MFIHINKIHTFVYISAKFAFCDVICLLLFFQIFQSIAELTNEEECEKIVEDTCKYFGKLDVLVRQQLMSNI